MIRCKSCGSPVVPGCPEVRGADGYVTVEAASDGVLRTVACHWRQPCSGPEAMRRHPRPLRTRSVHFSQPYSQVPA